MSKWTIISPKGIKLPAARVLDASDKEFFREVKAKTAEKFGKDSKAYATVMGGINPENATGSQFFFNTQVGLYLPEGQRVATLADWEVVPFDDLSQLNGRYTDTSALVLRSKQPTYNANASILNSLVKQAKDRDLEFSVENPLVISNPSLVRDDDSNNPYGLLVNLSENPKDTTNDERFAYQSDSIDIGGRSRTLWTKSDGLSRVYLNRGGGVGSGNGNLANSNDGGRVVVMDAEGVTLEDFIGQEVKPVQEKLARVKEFVAEV